MVIKEPQQPSRHATQMTCPHRPSTRTSSESRDFLFSPSSLYAGTTNLLLPPPNNHWLVPGFAANTRGIPRIPTRTGRQSLVGFEAVRIAQRGQSRATVFAATLRLGHHGCHVKSEQNAGAARQGWDLPQTAPFPPHMPTHSGWSIPPVWQPTPDDTGLSSSGTRHGRPHTIHHLVVRQRAGLTQGTEQRCDEETRKSPQGPVIEGNRLHTRFGGGRPPFINGHGCGDVHARSPKGQIQQVSSIHFSVRW